MKVVLLIVLFTLIFPSGKSQSLILNEISQGPSGTKEYVELLVTGPAQTDCSVNPPCLDLRSWIIDDNNGYLNGASVSGVGIAPGACRFSNDPFWSCIPAGTIIAIYNDADPNAAFGPDDVSMSDGNCALSLPISSNLFEKHTSQPSTSNGSYATTGWVSGGSWSHISLSNGEDGFLIYAPNNLSTPVFSIGWGPSNTLGDIYMGSSSSSDDVFFLTDCNYYNQASWVQGCAGDPSCGNDDQTPAQINPGQASCIGAMNHNCNPPSLTINSMDETCLGDCDGVIDVTVTGGTAPFVYTWNPVPPSGQGTANLSSLCPGTYTLNFVNDNGNGCNLTQSVTISSGPNCTNPCSIDALTANFSSCNPFDNTYNASGTVSITNPPASGTLTITIDDGINPIYDTIINAPFSTSEPWSISGMITGTGTNASISAVFSNDPTCFLAISQQVPASCPCTANAGTYSVSMTGNGQNNYILCFGDQIDFTHHQNEVLSPDYNHTNLAYQPEIGWALYSCLPGAGVEPANDPCYLGIIGTGYSFSDVNDLTLINTYPAGTFTNNTVYIVPITLYNNQTGDYSAYSSPNDCYDVGSVTTLTYLNDISQSLIEDCTNGSVQVTINGGYPEFFGGNFTGSNLNPSSASFTNTSALNGGTIALSGLNNGDNYSFNVSDPNGCSVLISGGPFSGQADATILSVGSFCPNENSVILNAIDPGGTWSGTGIVDPLTGELDPSLLGPGDHPISYTIPGMCGDQSDTLISISSFPIVIAPNDVTICLGQSVNLSASAQGGDGNYMYEWSELSGSIVGSGSQIQMSPNDTTTYIVEVTDGCGLTATDTILVAVIQSPNVNFTYNNSSGCAPLEVEFINTSSPLSTNCYWVFGTDTLAHSCDTISYSFLNEGCYDVSLYTSTNGCFNSITSDDLICVHPDAEALFSTNPDSATVFNPELQFTNSSENAQSYFWNFGDGDSSYVENPQHLFPAETGVYQVCLIANSTYGCHDTLCDNIRIVDEFLLYVPNAFSPNGDLLNDEFGPVISGFSGSFEFFIFDRWGQIVFKTENYLEKWNGSYKGFSEVAKSDIYTWLIKVQLNGTTDIRQYTGHVFLKK